MEQIILQVQMTNLQPVIDADSLPLYALAWHRALSNIPTHKLDEYYLRAFNRKENGFPVNATDIMAEWNRLTQQRGYDEYLPPQHQGKY